MPNAAHDAASRFRDDVERLTGGGGRIGLAVSGGPDSMAMLFLAHRMFPGQIEAATVDHGLRTEATDEAAMVARWCATNAIPHAVLRPDTPISGNIQSAARAVRYALLEAWRTERALDWLMTAHHADDQVETLIMRLNRGSGVAGLAGVRARNGAIIRPLLHWRRPELAAVVQAATLPVVHDPSNSDPRYDRAALRMRLADADWLDPAAAARSAAALADAEAALGWMTQDLATRHIDRDGDVWRLTATRFPRELMRRLLLHMLAQAEPDGRPPRGETLDAAIVQLSKGGKASIGNWLLTGGNHWTLRPAPPRRK